MFNLRVLQVAGKCRAVAVLRRKGTRKKRGRRGSLPLVARDCREGDGVVEDGGVGVDGRGLFAGDASVDGGGHRAGHVDLGQNNSQEKTHRGAQEHGKDDGLRERARGWLRSPESRGNGGGWRSSGVELMQPRGRNRREMVGE